MSEETSIFCSISKEELFAERDGKIARVSTDKSFGQCRNCSLWVTEENLILTGKPVAWQIVYSGALCEPCWTVVPPCKMDV
jgi:hypothetical protein